ncbi:glycosyltransferase family 4 protein [Nocardia sp. NPDC004068]|uniref:glycosyltransferase family 4 protein n=1 Tax=Nocardia sp. NPDC004068 TaxID=3364303 RepID=UPI0036CC7C07
MRILLIGPTGNGGSLPPYLDILTTALRGRGAHIDRLGTSGPPYDTGRSAFWSAERILAATEQLLARIHFDDYDLLSVHYGNLEIEQLLPTLWPARRPPAVLHVHSLTPTLFTTHVPEPPLAAAVDRAADMMDGFVFFGEYGRGQWDRHHRSSAPSIVSWLPTTIPPGCRPTSDGPLHQALAQCGGSVTGSLYGFAAPWKDLGVLLAACRRVTDRCKTLVAGPFWDDAAQTGIDLARRGSIEKVRAEVIVVPTYLGPADRALLIRRSDFAVFPYRHHPAFQGSGAIADYLVHGIPVVATDVANMAELIGDAGIVTTPDDPTAFAAAIDRIVDDGTYRKALATNAARRAHQFTANHHAAECLRFYAGVIESRGTS